MNKPVLSMTQLVAPHLEAVLAPLSRTGKLCVTDLGLTYLDIDDNYIYQTFPLITNPQATLPDYFGENLIGAHISVIYPEEGIQCSNEDLQKPHHFTVSHLFTALLEDKRYYILKVQSPTLTALRRKYGLADKLCFKNHWIDLHITVAVIDNQSLADIYSN